VQLIQIEYMQPVIYVDLRCLQDPDYRVRGIGHHLAALLRTRERSSFSNWKTIGLTNPQSPKLPHEYALLVDEVSSSVNPCCNGAPAVFVDGTPMTHDTRFNIRFQNHPAFFCAAVLYDFIPLEWPGYLPTVASRIDYLGKMARLRNFDLFLPISEYTAWRLSELLGVSRGRISVTGASVRRSLYELRNRLEIVSSPYDEKRPYFLIVVGPDMRKNPEVAVKAVRCLNLVYGQRIPLKVAGHYHDAYKRDLLRLACHAEGEGFLEFCPDIRDEELARLFAGALATIAPSHIEGFSLPIVEASVCGCPVVASTCAAQMELIEQTEALFPSNDSAVLYEKLDALLNQPALRAFLVASQAHLGAKFHEDAVGRRFWSAIQAAVENRRKVAFVTKPRKARLAFLSPCPPDQSDAAFYTAMTMRAGENLFSSDLYSDATRPLTFEGNFRDAGGVSLAPIIDGQYDGVISVLGNSYHHAGIFEVFERYGGPCILHDGRLTQMYFHYLGQGKFLKFAAKLLGRSVSMEEVNTWLQNCDAPSLLLKPIIQRASPLIVHTLTQQTWLKEHYGVDAHVTTCCPTIFFDDEELAPSAKRAARNRLGIPATAFLVSSFGGVGSANGLESCILAVELLRSWNIPAELYFVGDVESETGDVNRICTICGIAGHVHSGPEFADRVAHRNFLIASDAAVQLGSYGFRQFSTALTDCISAGLSCVAPNELAKSCDAPVYVSIVPDRFSPLHVAEQLALIWETQTGRASYADARATYLQTHNFEHYGKRLIEILGIA
jgi:glycosyltransferase involved in cell wall biosynthesis